MKLLCNNKILIFNVLVNKCFYVTPFVSIYFTPVQIYLGQLSATEIAFKCGVQLFWTVIIFALGNILWIKGQKKLVVQGG